MRKVVPAFSLMRATRSGRRTARVRSTSGGSGNCSWCRMVGTAALQCTWKSRGMQDKFTSAVCVRNACFGHMVASVWDGERVRQENKRRLKRYLKESMQLGADEEPVQHAWAAHVLDACRYEELRQRHTCSSDSCGSSDGCDSSGSDGSSDGLTHWRPLGTGARSMRAWMCCCAGHGVVWRRES